MLRRLKKQVLSQLPPKIRQRMIVATDPTITKSISVALKRNFNKSSHKKLQHRAHTILLASPHIPALNCRAQEKRRADYSYSKRAPL